jgi:acyl-coenzyme A thioesterase PaaI-like protein
VNAIIMAQTIPEGFVDPENGGFTGNIGPIFQHKSEAHVHSGFYVEQRHCNPQARCHGGWLSTFADVALVRQGSLIALPLVTISLTVDFIDAAHLGEWVESRCEIVSKTRSMVFVQGTATASGRPALRMNGIFRIIAPKS